MAVNRADRYPGRWNPADADYPLGTPKNRTSDTAKDGSYFEKDWISDYEAFFGALLSDAGETPNGTVDTAQASQLFNAMLKRRPVENRFKGNQNWNVEGSTGDPLPSATPTLYTVGAEIAAGRFVVGANLVNATYTGGLFDADSGSYYIEYDGDFTGDFYGIKLADGTITQTGCSIAFTGGKTRVTVDMSSAPAHKFLQFSEQVGIAPDVSDDESSANLIPTRAVDVTSERVSGVTYTNNTGRLLYVLVRADATAPSSNVVAQGFIDDVNVTSHRLTESSGIANALTTVNLTVPKEATYRVNVSSGSISRWSEI